MGEAVIEFRGVSASQESKRLYNVSLQLRQSDFNVITMLDTGTLEAVQGLLVCETQPTDGSISIDGMPYDRTLSIGCITPVQTHLIEAFTAAQNIYGMRRGAIFNWRRAERECDDLISRFNFDFSGNVPVEKLNWERRKIVEFLRAYVEQPKVLVLSEMFGIFSFENILHIKQLLTEMRAKGTYIILLTRKYEDIFKMGDTVAVLRYGYLIDSFDRNEVLQHPQRLYEALLGGSTLFAAEQFSPSDGGIDVLDVVRIGTQCMLSQENANSAFQKYARLTEQYFGDARCTLYVKPLRTQNRFEPYYCNQYLPEQVPLTKNDAIGKIFALEEPLTFMPFDPGIHSRVEDFPYTDILYQPIRQDDVCCGVLQVSFLKPHVLSNKDSDYLRTVSDEIFLILDNCRLMGHSSHLQESHHRIKNNLQLITSMLMLQKSCYAASGRDSFSLREVEQLIDTITARVQSMAAIHNLLSRRDVVDGIITVSAIFDELFRFYQDMIDIRVDSGIDAPISQHSASSLALVMNELINNSVKHNQGREGLACRIAVRKQDGLIEIAYRDNGRGFPEEALQNGVGMTVIRTIVQAEFWGSIRTYNDGGACVVLTLKGEALR